jgi:hypothetical protein
MREGLTINGKNLSDHLEAKNQPKAIESIESLAKQKDIARTLEEKDVLKVHELIFSGLYNILQNLLALVCSHISLFLLYDLG